MPKSAQAARLVETAAIWPAAWGPSQARARRALAIVSSVVKVLDETMTRVRAGSRPATVSAKWAPSTFETKWRRGPSRSGLSARAAMAGPRSEPPMPILTTSANAPPAPEKRPARTCSAKARKRSSVPRTSSPAGAGAPPRSAMCRTARRSVTLMASPANIASRRASTPAARASARRAASASGVELFLGEVDGQVVEVEGQGRDAPGIAGEQLAQMDRCQPRRVLADRGPGGLPVGGRHRGRLAPGRAGVLVM